ncbi:hypothetical protein [Parasulfitobacter algicola]|uniref:DUF4952 domain-containing protein n=1 Tax=Parasulfitobacter algicola TaxID=2614809 RepID=A0ABX2ITK2_9RHOB|nr:hypothetical protein [Sulfitobacter algicola]NSX55331.1 hypothetical protein [Sulfitobacter algicola]
MKTGILTVLSLCLLGSVTYFVWPKTDICQAFLKNDGLNLPYLGKPECLVVMNSQKLIQVKYSVPAENLIEAHAYLQTEYGLGDLRFVCCGYETRKGNGQGHAKYPITEPEIFDHLLGPGAILGGTINMFVPAEGADESASPSLLGTLDGVITIDAYGV